MPTTAAGTVYTITSFTSSAGEACRRAVADAHAGDADLPLVLFCHGNPGTVLTSADFQFGAGYTTVREWVIDQGYAYVEGHGAGANWGNDAGRVAYRAMTEDVMSVWDIGWIVVIGRSMGALVGAYMASRDDLVAPRCRGFVSLSGTANLTDRYSTASTGDKTNMEAAYGISTDAQWRAAVADYDPLLAPTSVWEDKRAIMQWDTSDTTVPYQINGQAWRTKYGQYLSLNAYAETSGGDHNSTPNNATHNTATINFLGSALSAPYAPPQETPSAAFSLYVVQPGTLQLLPVSVR